VLHAAEPPAEPLVLEVFPGGDSTSELIEDDGETTAWRQGVEARTPLRLWSRAGGRLRLEIGVREGRFRPGPRRVRATIHGCPRPTSVWLDAVRLPSQGRDAAEQEPGFWWETGLLHVCWPDDGSGRTLEVEPAP
jgi:hypothetical protein